MSAPVSPHRFPLGHFATSLGPQQRDVFAYYALRNPHDEVLVSVRVRSARAGRL